MALLREIYADYERGVWGRGDLFQPDFELVFAGDFLDHGTFRGLEEAWRGWSEWLGQWEDWRAAAVSYHDVGERIAVVIQVDGAAKSTGIPLSQESGNLWEFRDGLASRIVLYAKAADMLRDVGLESP